MSGFRAPQRPLPARALNAAWGALQAIGVGRASLAPGSLQAAARRSVPSADAAAANISEPLQRLVESVEREAALHPLGRFAVRQMLVRLLANRARLADAVAQHPEIEEIPVKAPVFIVGLQRTGTTLLHRLLGTAPGLRPLLTWEAFSPAPLPGTAHDGRDPRMRPAEQAERAMRYLAPEFFAIHPGEAHEPEEDVLLMDLSFLSPTFDAILRVPGYSAWFWETDQTPAYQMLHSAIQLLLWQRPGRFLGKTPHHLGMLDRLFEVFPDARVIHTHRDPVRVTASYCSMICHGRLVFSDDVDPAEVGRTVSERSLHNVNRALELRDGLDPNAFLDVAYADLVADPLKQVRRIHEFLGEELKPETVASMESWRSEHRQDRHGVHRYQLEDFGLERDELSERFRPYRERYAISEEA